jgi:hypothetical protein
MYQLKSMIPESIVIVMTTQNPNSMAAEPRRPRLDEG